MNDVTYDVYVFHDYRWQLEKQFAGAENKNRAIELAEHIYREKHILAYKVIEERTDPDSGEVREKKVANKKKVDELPKRPAQKAAAASPAPSPTKPAKKKTAKTPNPTSRPAPNPADRSKTVARVLQLAIALAVFTVVLALASVSGLLAVGGLAILASGASFIAAAAVGLGMLANDPTERDKILRLLAHFLSERKSEEVDVEAPPVAAPSPVATPAEPVPPIAAPAPDGQETSATSAALIRLDPHEPDSAVTSERLEVLKSIVLGFATIGKAWAAQLQKIPDAIEKGQLSAHAKFGMHLFLAGLCEQARKLKQWNFHEFSYVLRRSLEELFGDPQSATRFVQNYSEYLAEPRYAEMFHAGLSWDGQISDGMPATHDLMARWLRKSDGAPVKDVTVVFTDIIGSTEFTQIHGDRLQMELVQAHDRIVRQAVEDHSGRWIKHTGDGAMLAFDQAIGAVRAALQMQNEIRVHNELMPSLPLRLRIGLSSGQPIKAGDDLFGSTVQLSARVCALADAGQIIVSSRVQETCASSGFRFIDMGTKTLKGFPEPQQVYALDMG